MEREIKIVLRGDFEADLELAFEEVVRLIKANFTSGKGSNDTGSFTFEVTNDD
jgi:hypothetical protein